MCISAGRATPPYLLQLFFKDGTINSFREVSPGIESVATNYQYDSKR